MFLSFLTAVSVLSLVDYQPVVPILDLIVEHWPYYSAFFWNFLASNFGVKISGGVTEVLTLALLGVMTAARGFFRGAENLFGRIYTQSYVAGALHVLISWAIITFVLQFVGREAVQNFWEEIAAVVAGGLMMAGLLLFPRSAMATTVAVLLLFGLDWAWPILVGGVEALPAPPAE